MTFWQTKNGKVRRIPITDTIEAVLTRMPRIYPWVFTNPSTKLPYTTISKVFERALLAPESQPATSRFTPCVTRRCHA